MSDPETVTGAPERGPDADAAAREVLDNSGDSMGDDAVPPEEGLPGDGESIAGRTDSATAGGPTESA